MRYLGVYTMIYFVFKKAGKRLKMNKRKFINFGIVPVIVVSFIANTSIIVIMEIGFHKANTN